MSLQGVPLAQQSSDGSAESDGERRNFAWAAHGDAILEEGFRGRHVAQRISPWAGRLAPVLLAAVALGLVASHFASRRRPSTGSLVWANVLYAASCPAADPDTEALQKQPWPRPDPGPAPPIVNIRYIALDGDSGKQGYMEEQLRSLAPLLDFTWERLSGTRAEALRDDKELSSWRDKGFSQVLDHEDWTTAARSYSHYQAISGLPSTYSEVEGFVLIMEDNVSLRPDFVDMWKKLWPWLPEDWDVLRLGCQEKCHDCSHVVNSFVDVAAWSRDERGACSCCGAQAYVVHPAAKSRVLSRFETSRMTWPNGLLSAPTPTNEDPHAVAPLKSFMAWPPLASPLYEGQGHETVFRMLKTDSKVDAGAESERSADKDTKERAADEDAEIVAAKEAAKQAETAVRDEVHRQVEEEIKKLESDAEQSIKETEAAKAKYEKEAAAAEKAAEKQVEIARAAQKEADHRADAAAEAVSVDEALLTAAEKKAVDATKKVVELEKSLKEAQALAQTEVKARKKAEEEVAERKAEVAAEEKAEQLAEARTKAEKKARQNAEKKAKEVEAARLEIAMELAEEKKKAAAEQKSREEGEEALQKMNRTIHEDKDQLHNMRKSLKGTSQAAKSIQDRADVAKKEVQDLEKVEQDLKKSLDEARDQDEADKARADAAEEEVKDLDKAAQELQKSLDVARDKGELDSVRADAAEEEVKDLEKVELDLQKSADEARDQDKADKARAEELSKELEALQSQSNATSAILEALQHSDEELRLSLKQLKNESQAYKEQASVSQGELTSLKDKLANSNVMPRPKSPEPVVYESVRDILLNDAISGR